MDQIQREKIAAKLKKIKALAERGVGGEKETAMRMYEDLKARYELEDEEIMLDAVTLHWFGYATELEEELLTQFSTRSRAARHITFTRANTAAGRSVAAIAQRLKQRKSHCFSISTKRN